MTHTPIAWNIIYLNIIKILINFLIQARFVRNNNYIQFSQVTHKEDQLPLLNLLKEVRNLDNDEPESELADLHDVILHYLQKNPNAADSLKGIMNWWLPPAYGKVDAAGVEQVLEQLIAEGWVKKISLLDGAVLYRRRES